MTDRRKADLKLVTTEETALPALSIDALDLDNLPARLTDAMMAALQNLADTPLPALHPCDERHFAQCLRVMLSVLPKRATDDVSGELFVEAYRRKLGKFSNDAISFMADKALERCKWFPTIHECLEILDDWRRWDIHCQRRAKARRAVGDERRAREQDERARNTLTGTVLTQDDVDKMTPEMIRIGLACKALRNRDDGTPAPWFTKDGEEIPY